jgi:hypothetical protein
MKKLKLVLKKCLVCKNDFYAQRSANRKYCSRKCSHISWAKQAKKWKKDFPKGHVSWNQGLKLPYKSHPKMKGHIPWQKGKTKYDLPQLSNAGRKKGFIDSKFGTGGYSAKHQWIKRKLGKPTKCEFCGSINYLQWANKSHKYKWELDDWLSLCRKCHQKYDKKI